MEEGRAGNDVGLMPILDLPPFDLALPARIVFGRGKAAQAPDMIAGFGGCFLLVHGANPERAEWLVTALCDGALGLALGLVLIPIVTRVVSPLLDRFVG